jgi:hypothetical protein
MKVIKKVVTVLLDASEIDTVLAALRLWQIDSAHIADGTGALADMSEEHGDALSKTQIDDLCERINFAPEAQCDCDDRSWHGEEHDSACPFTLKGESRK